MALQPGIMALFPNKVVTAIMVHYNRLKREPEYQPSPVIRQLSDNVGGLYIITYKPQRQGWVVDYLAQYNIKKSAKRKLRDLNSTGSSLLRQHKALKQELERARDKQQALADQQQTNPSMDAQLQALSNQFAEVKKKYQEHKKKQRELESVGEVVCSKYFVPMAFLEEDFGSISLRATLEAEETIGDEDVE